MATPQKKRRGRPVEKPMAEQIPDSPENIARAIVTTPPKKRGQWKYQDVRGSGITKKR